MKEIRFNKTLIILLGVILLSVVSVISYAQVPQTTNYQGFLTDSAGDPVNDTVDMTFRIYNSADPLVVPVGSQSWIETHTLVQVTQGVYSVVLGSAGSPLTLNFNTQYWLGIEVGIDGEMDPRQQLTAVPYALNADMLDGQHATDLGDITAVNPGTGLSGGGVSGDVTVDISVPLELSGTTGSLGSIIKGTNDADGYGIAGISQSGTGVRGSNISTGNYGYLGGTTYGIEGVSTLNTYAGVYGRSSAPFGTGVDGMHIGSGNFGRLGTSTAGVYGSSTFHNSSGTLGGEYGVTGSRGSNNGNLGGEFYGVYGYVTSGNAVMGYNQTSGSSGQLGSTLAGVRAWAGSSGTAGYFDGNVFITGNLNVTGSLTGYTEIDPVFSTWDRSAGISITESQISDLTHFTTANETDPVFGIHASSGITAGQITNWDLAYGWGDHALGGYDRTDDSWTNTGGGVTTASRVGIGTTTLSSLLTVAGPIESTLGGIIFPDGTTQSTATSSGDGHSLDSADASQTNVVYVNNSGNVGVGTITPTEQLDVIGKLKVTPGTYSYEQGNAVLGFQTPRCSCDTTDNNDNCAFTFYSMNDEGTTCYDWYQEGAPPITPIIDYSLAYDRVSNPKPALEMSASNDLIVSSFKIQPARYLYTKGFSTSSGHLTPQCPCDTAIEESTAECGDFNGNFYTNVDRGTLCYDWHLSGGSPESYRFGRSIPIALSADLENGIRVNDFTYFSGDVRITNISPNGGKLAVTNGALDPNNSGIYASSIFGTGVHGDGSPGVKGTSTGGEGVRGESETGYGVHGEARDSGSDVIGSYGVYGSDTRTGNWGSLGGFDAAVKGVGTSNWAGVFEGNVLITGYTVLGDTSGVPPAADCNGNEERGRMKFDRASGLLFICANSGWISK